VAVTGRRAAGAAPFRAAARGTGSATGAVAALCGVGIGTATESAAAVP